MRSDCWPIATTRPPLRSDDSNAADAAAPDAEVSFVTKDLSPILPKAKIAATVAIDDVMMRVREAANWHGNGGGVRYAALANAAADVTGTQSDMKLAYAPEGPASDPYAGFETRVVPENVTLLPKTNDQVTGRQSRRRTRAYGQKGETAISILRDQGASPDDARAIAANARPPWPRRRPQGRREAANPDGAGRSGAERAAEAVTG